MVTKFCLTYSERRQCVGGTGFEYRHSRENRVPFEPEFPLRGFAGQARSLSSLSECHYLLAANGGSDLPISFSLLRPYELPVMLKHEMRARVSKL